jgi:hypothetical protein
MVLLLHSPIPTKPSLGTLSEARGVWTECLSPSSTLVKYVPGLSSLGWRNSVWLERYVEQQAEKEMNR